MIRRHHSGLHHSGLHHRHARDSNNDGAGNNHDGGEGGGHLMEEVPLQKSSNNDPMMDTSMSKLPHHSGSASGAGGGGSTSSRAAISGKYKKRFESRRGVGKDKDDDDDANAKMLRRRSPFTRWLTASLIAGIPVYLVAIYYFFFRSSSLSATVTFSKTELGDLAMHLQRKREESRAGLDQQEYNHRMIQEMDHKQRSQQRRLLTRPPPLTEANKNDERYQIRQHEIYLSDQHPRKDYAPLLDDAANWKDLEPVASLENLCGYLAQNASLAHPQAYLKRDALTAQSRVLITGILNPVGFHLALALHEHCKVEVLIGMDPMFPNTAGNRMSLQEQLQMLTVRMPKLAKPLFVPYLGVDPPKLNKKGLMYLDTTTGEMDLVASFQPTHVVHMASYSPVVYSNAPHWDIRNMGSPYVTEEYDPPLYQIRQSMAAQEHILHCISRLSNLQERPHFIFASSNLIHYHRPAARDEYRGSSSAAAATTSQEWYGRPWAHIAKESLTERDEVVHTHAKLMDEVLADVYHARYGVYSVALRLPNAIYGKWDHAASEVHRVLQSEADRAAAARAMQTGKESWYSEEAAAGYNSTLPARYPLDLVHLDNIVDGILAAMQFRASKPVAFEFSAAKAVTIGQIQQAANLVLDPTSRRLPTFLEEAGRTGHEVVTQTVARKAAFDFLSWGPSIPLAKGLVKTLAWHLDRLNPFGPPPHWMEPDDNDEDNDDQVNQENAGAASKNSTSLTSVLVEGLPSASGYSLLEPGDSLLERYQMKPCEADDVVCHAGHTYMPCASECGGAKKHCTPSFFDSAIETVREVTEECEIVLYTQKFGDLVTDLSLPAEYVEEEEDSDEPSMCNFAFVSTQSRLVQRVVQKVPDEELARLGVHPGPEDQRHGPGSIRELKIHKLNGRLLYRGWILVWIDTEKSAGAGPGKDVTFEEEMLLKLSPGRLFHRDVKHAIFLDQSFPVPAKPDDIRFLVHEMHRPSWKPRVVKRQTRPKAKFLLPAEPERRAVVLMSELKFQESSDSERLPPGERITTLEATRFMRYELGEEPLEKEPLEIKAQREFYERMPSFLNRDIMKSGSESAYKFEMGVWARSRWVLHDLEHDEGRQLRCEWYQEHIDWKTPLDQLSFAYVMARRDVERRIALAELDDNVIVGIDDKTQMKKLLSDTFEWLPLKTPQNKLFTPYEEMRMLPYEMDYPESEYQDLPPHPAEGHQLLFARVISDRLMAYARQTWNQVKEAEEAAAAKVLAEQKEHEERPGLTAAQAKEAEEEAARKAAQAQAAVEAAAAAAAEAEEAARLAREKAAEAQKAAQERAAEEAAAAAGVDAARENAERVKAAAAAAHDKTEGHAVGPEHIMGEEQAEGEDEEGEASSNKNDFGEQKEGEPEGGGR